ncbi:MAG TPA: CsgG/HfaB family protein [Candidatus Nitrosotalea sp.]|nr:CsgG/HfaB family protein [Candidatus Nitrosotalea sp.]
MRRASRDPRAAALGCLLAAALTLSGPGRPGAAPAITVAVLDFDTSGAPALGPNGGIMAGELLAAALSARDGVHLVERTSLRRALEEQTLGLAGVVDPATAARVRRLVGAQVLVTGRVFSVANRLVVSVRAVDTETGHVEAVVAEGRPGDDLRALSGGVAEKIARLLSERGEALAPGRERARVADAGSDLARELAGTALPRVSIRVRETVLNVEEPHSVAADELIAFLIAANIEVRRAGEQGLPVELDEYLAKPEAPAGADVVILGKAAGRFGLRTGDLVSVKARVKLTAVDTATRRVLAVTETEAKEIDVAPHEAAVQAIVSATREASRDFVLKLVRAWNRKAPGGSADLREPAQDK